MAESDAPTDQTPEAGEASEAGPEPAPSGAQETTARATDNGTQPAGNEPAGAEADLERREGSFLRPGEQSAWERWELPAMKSGHVVSSKGLQPKTVEDEVEIEPLSLDELESIREAARQEGFAEGREAGYREGREQGLRDGADEVEAQAQALRRAVAALARPLADAGEDLEEALVVSATEIARNVIRAELRADPSLIQGVAREVVDALARARGTLRLHLHPEDLELIEAGDAGWRQDCELVPDASLSRGGVRAERGPSSTDFTLEQRFRAAVSGFVTAAYDTGLADDEPGVGPAEEPVAADGSSDAAPSQPDGDALDAADGEPP